MNRHSISVALCTYNGERFLAAQLASIARQTRLPDELVICDDGSTDGTVRVVEEFASAAPFPVILTRNDTNLGSRKNFEQTVRLCGGDFIACCDQDDIWYSMKLERCEAALANPDIGLVFSDADVVGEDLSPLSYRLSEPVGIGRKTQQLIRRGRAMEVLARANIVTGTTMMFKAKWRNLVLPIPTDGDRIHDGWISLLIAAVDGVAYIFEPLMAYRQHDAQETGLRGFFEQPDVELQRMQQAASLRRAIEVLKAWCGEDGVPPQASACLYLALAHLSHNWESDEYSVLRATALAIDPTVRLSGRWKYNIATRVLGVGGAERLVHARRRLRRRLQRRRANSASQVHSVTPSSGMPSGQSEL